MSLQSRSHKVMIAVFTIPAILAFLIVFAYPVMRTILMSFYNIDNVVAKMSEWEFAGFGNYIKLLNTPLFRQTWVTFLKIWIFGGIVVTFIALLFAMIITSGIRGKAFFRAAIYLPNIISAVALANMWIHYAFNTKWGFFHNLFSAIGWESMANFQWTSPDHLFMSMMLAFSFGAVGYYMLIYISGIEKIPQDLFEAAQIDGSSVIHSFFHITLPLLRGVFNTTLTLWTTSALGFYIWSQMFSSNRDPSAQIMTPMYYMIRSTFGDMASEYTETNAGIGAAICVMIMIVAAVVFTIIKRVVPEDKEAM